MGTTVRVVNPRRQTRLVQEHRDEIVVLRQVVVQALDGVKTLKPARPAEASQIHRPHAADRELGDELEAIEPVLDRMLFVGHDRPLVLEA